MYPIQRILLLITILGVLCVLPARAAIERILDKDFAVAPGSLVRVAVSGAPIRAIVGAAGSSHLQLRQKFRTDDAAEADRLLEDYEIVCAQQGDEAVLSVKAKHRTFFGWWTDNRVQFAVELTVPADVRLDLDTSGGSIAISGEMVAAVRAETSGGSISVDGGTDLNLDTSGGSIHVGRALGRLRADTSGGGITVEYAGAEATDLNLDTSGGSIHVGLDPAARIDIVGDTSGGRVRVEGFADFEVERRERDHVSGRLNGGGGRLRADTSGGSIIISVAAP